MALIVAIGQDGVPTGCQRSRLMAHAPIFVCIIACIAAAPSGISIAAIVDTGRLSRALVLSMANRLVEAAVAKAMALIERVSRCNMEKSFLLVDCVGLIYSDLFIHARRGK